MKNSKEKFIEFAIRNNIIQFGEFKLKSGRVSPYFFNAGLFYEGQALNTLAKAYADLYQSNHLNTRHLFGPAYKGIVLATLTSAALSSKHIETTVTFNRKEIKDHGEGGALIGAPLTGPTTIIDDVITAGTAFREAKAFIEAHGGQVDSVLIALDRCEKGLSSRSAIDEIREKGIKVHAIATVFDLIEYLKTHGQAERAKQIEESRMVDD